MNWTPDLCPNQRILLNDSFSPPYFLVMNIILMPLTAFFHPSGFLIRPSVRSSNWTRPELLLTDHSFSSVHVPTPLPITSKAFDLIRRFTGYCWISQRPRSITVFCPCCCFQRYCVSAGVCEEVRLKDESLLTVGGNLTLSRLLHQMMNAESLHAKKETLWVLAALLSQHHSGESIWAFFGKALTFRPLLKLLSDYF